MSDQRLDKLETAVTTMADKFSEFVAIESGRQERDKHQLETNNRLLEHMEKFDAEYKPILMRSKKHQEWIDSFIGKYILPGLFLTILAGAGYSFS